MKVTREIRRSRTTRYALMAAGLLFVLAILHAVGWLIITAVIAAVSYQAGKRNMVTRARRHLNANGQYGQQAHGQAVTGLLARLRNRRIWHGKNPGDYLHPVIGGWVLSEDCFRCRDGSEILSPVQFVLLARLDRLPGL